MGCSQYVFIFVPLFVAFVDAYIDVRTTTFRFQIYNRPRTFEHHVKVMLTEQWNGTSNEFPQGYLQERKKEHQVLSGIWEEWVGRRRTVEEDLVVVN